MKKLIFSAVVFVSLFSYGQRGVSDEWLLSIGVNALNSLGTQSPINSPDDWALKYPIAVAAEKQWTRDLAIEVSASVNGISEDDRFDPAAAPRNFTYFALDTNVKYYFGERIFPRTEWLDFYANGGVGFFHISEVNITGNLGGGVLVWLNTNRSFGLRAQIMGKFAINNAESGFDNNHYQYTLQAVFKL